MSRLQQLRAEFQPELPKILQSLKHVAFKKQEGSTCLADEGEIQRYFPHTFGRPIFEVTRGAERLQRVLRVGIVLSGGQAAGGHNVITGLFDALKALSPQSKLYGFLDGPSGIVKCATCELTKERLTAYRNQGGFDLIGSGRTKIETQEQLEASLKTAHRLQLDGIVIVGGDDSNTNAAVLAEFFSKEGSKTAVVGVPKTIDGDLKNAYVETSFGFDTATKTYAELIGNIARDAASAKKYTHFIKLMGRSASHITLECALATRPNIALIGEEIARHGLTLKQVSDQVADIIEKRAESGKHYGIILIPEGLIEFIPEINRLIAELNRLSAEGKGPQALLGEQRRSYDSLPQQIQKQLLLTRDPHGNVQVSMIETEKLLIAAVGQELRNRGFKGKFCPQSHFFGYEGRAGFPSNFDAQYCYALGHAAALFIDEGMTGYMTCIGNLSRPVSQWSVMGLPITALMHMEMRKGKRKPVIRKSLVDLDDKPFAFFASNREAWALEDHYKWPGPIQFFGDSELVNSVPLTIQF